MRLRFVANLTAALLTTPATQSANALQAGRSSNPSESRIAVGTTSLYIRAIGQGPPIIVLHGGPDFDHGYLLPDLDRLADTFRLIYYDQRGRGRSAEGVRPEDVTLASDVEDVDRCGSTFAWTPRRCLGTPGGRCWPWSTRCAISSDVAVVRKVYLERLGADMDRQRSIMVSSAYQAGDPEAVTARYRIHFAPALKRAEDYERMMATMKAGFTSQGKEGILKARTVEDQLMRDTWQLAAYDLLPKLDSLRVPTLVIAGDHDFMVVAAERIARAIPGAELVTIKDCGHFAFLECPDEVRHAVNELFRRPR